MLIFDDSYEHEAANLSETEERVILLIDIWHPDLTEGERSQIKVMFRRMQKMINERQQRQSKVKL